MTNSFLQCLIIALECFHMDRSWSGQAWMDAYATLRWVERCGPKRMFMKQEGKSKEKERGQ